MPREETVRRAIREALTARGAAVISTTGAYGGAGLPDYIACYRGRFLAIEVKRPGGRTTELQEVWLARIRAAGGIAFVARSAYEAVEALKLITEEEQNDGHRTAGRPV